MQVRQLAEHIFFIGAFALLSPSCVDSEPIVSGYADQAAAPALPTGTTGLQPTVGYPANLPYVVSPAVDQDEIDPLNFGVEPSVISAEPVTAAAIGGTTVTIQGANFQPGATVWFGDTAGENVFFINAGFINVDTPVSSPGVVDISIENPDGGVGTLEDAFVFTADLELDAISPSEGSVLGGETVTITGVGFDESVQVLIGGRLALAVQALDLFTLEAVTPPGTAGLQDVRVLVPGEAVAELERSFRYAGPPDIERVFPPAAPAVGGTTVVIYGKRLDSESVVTFDGKAAEVLDVDLSGQALTVRVPSGNAGPADVTVENEFGEDVLLGGFAWTQPAAALAVQHITPAAGPIAGGNTIALVLSNHVSEEPTAVLIDGQPADIFDSTADGVVEVVVPAGIAGEVDVEVTHRGETTIATDGYRYEDIFSLSVVSPAFGDAAGGDVRVVWGTRFDLLNASDLSVQLGPLQAPAVELETTETMVTTVFETPPCSPGPNDVVVKSGAMEAVLPGGYDCIAESVALLAADPGVVAQSGGTLIRLVGTGLPAEAIVTIGGQVAPVVERESQVAIWVRAPRGEVGTAEVRIISPELKAPLILTDGVTYRDPTNPNAGIWGEPVDGTVNISVFDGQGAGPLAGALAILGADPETSLKCITDDRGQCVISERGLVGPLQLTVHKYQYSAYTIAGFTGRDATVFIREQDPPAQTGPPGAGGGAQPPPAPINSIVGTISGEVIGLGKYVLPPAPDCTVLGTPDGEQCTECSEGTTCPGELSCTPIADTGSWCFQTCDSDDECNNGYVCSPTGYGSRCLPFTGTVSAQCRTSRRSFFGSNPEPGLGADVTADNPFFTIDSRPGEVTVYCVAGYTNPQNGQFIATRMGIQPTVLVYIDEETTGISVELDIPLSRTLRMRVFDLPEHEAGIGLPSFRNALDLGAEGWIEFPSIPSTTIGEMRLFPGYPESLTPFGPDAALTFYSWVNPNASGNIPSSYFMAHKVKSIDGDPLSLRSDDGAWASEVSGMRGDLHDVWSAAADDVWAVGPNGRLVHLGPLGWGIQPQFTDVDLHGIWGASANQIWAVGDYGTILSFDGVTWASDIDADTVDWHIRDVHGQWAVGDGGIIRRSNGQWVTQPVIHSSGLTAVFSHEDSAVAVGLAGKVLTYEDGAWSADLPVTTGEMLRAVWADGGGTYVVGDDGIVLFRAPNGEWAVTRISDRDLHAVVGNQDSIWVAGTVGAVWRLDRYSGQWFDETSADLGRVDLKSLSLSAGGLRSAGTTSLPFGPWMAFVEAVNPAPYQVYSPGNVAWDYRHDNPVPSYNTLFLTSNDGKNLWTILSAGPISSVYLPPLDDLTGWDPLMAGTKYMSLTRSLTPGFSMGGYRFNKLSMWRRTTWSSLYGNFY